MWPMKVSKPSAASIFSKNKTKQKLFFFCKKGIQNSHTKKCKELMVLVLHGIPVKVSSLTITDTKPFYEKMLPIQVNRNKD